MLNLKASFLTLDLLVLSLDFKREGVFAASITQVPVALYHCPSAPGGGGGVEDWEWGWGGGWMTFTFP